MKYLLYINYILK